MVFPTAGGCLAGRPAPAGKAGDMHDETYKKLFAFPRMVEDLLRGFVAGPRPDDLDFATLRKLSSEYVSDELLKRHGDAVWRVRLRGRWLYLVVLLEFQSRDEPRMALRILTWPANRRLRLRLAPNQPSRSPRRFHGADSYPGLLYEEMVRNGVVEAGEPLPAVLPVVLYNGARRWRSAREMRELIAAAGPELAPCQPAQRYHVVDERHLAEDDLPGGNLMTSVVRLERIGAAADLVHVVEVLRATLSDPRDSALRRVFLDWVRQLAERLTPSGGELPPTQTLEELKMTLVERVAEWPKQWLREGIEQGVKQGIEQGVKQGMKQGIEQGLAHERALLYRQAALRFGAGTASRVSRAVERIADPQGLAAAGDWIVRADTGDELVARLTQLAGGQGRP